MEKIRSGFNYSLLFVSLITLLFVLINICYAEVNTGGYAHAPEPGTMALIATGLFGGLVRFARRKFHEFKRFIDILGGALGLVAVLPVIGFTGLFIKVVSPGPVLFTQKRVGKNGKVFTIYKIRTMKLDAEKYTGAMWARENDPRLIKFGKYIRKMHIDELPQFFNVIKGEMSIVGPRPERPEIVAKLKEVIVDYEKRLNVKPGITGLAQVWHKYDETLEDVKKKIKYDLLYIRKMCLLVDLRILFQTVIVSALGRGAR